eukprot:3999749-Pleurochrysis_carterae.AAC.2
MSRGMPSRRVACKTCKASHGDGRAALVKSRLQDARLSLAAALCTTRLNPSRAAGQIRRRRRRPPPRRRSAPAPGCRRLAPRAARQSRPARAPEANYDRGAQRRVRAEGLGGQADMSAIVAMQSRHTPRNEDASRKTKGERVARI